jgi:tricorn protease
VKSANPKEGEPEGGHDAIVTPMAPAEAADLRYHEWEYTRRLAVEAAGEKQIGYVHLRAMGKGNIAEWAKGFYPVFNRSGLIIDVRRNNGGNIDSWVLSTLLRKAWMFWNQHAGRADSWNMQYAFRGHLVVLCDPFPASDGEAFAEGFKRRTWGGEVWLSSSNTLSDGGLASAGEYGVFAPDEQGRYGWIVEGRGVEPDIEVDNPPHAAFQGKDAQLEAAIAHLKQLIKDKPVTIPPVPELPNKARKQ